MSPFALEGQHDYIFMQFPNELHRIEAGIGGWSTMENPFMLYRSNSRELKSELSLSSE